MFGGSGFGVGLTVAELALPPGHPVDPVPVQLADALPVHARSAEEKAFELQRLQQLKAMLAAYELDLVGGWPATGRTPSTASTASRARPRVSGVVRVSRRVCR